jgi:hypothetical protein
MKGSRMTQAEELDAFIESLTTLAHNWRYSDELIGNVVRIWLGRGTHGGQVHPGRLTPREDA